MRVVAFLEFLEGKHRIHVNPFNYTSLLTIHWAFRIASLCSLIAVGPCTQHLRADPGPLFPSMQEHLGQGALLSSASGLPPFPLQGLGYLIAAND